MNDPIEYCFIAKVTFDEVFIERQIIAWHKGHRAQSGEWNTFHAHISHNAELSSPAFTCLVAIDESSKVELRFECLISVLVYGQDQQQQVSAMLAVKQGYIWSPPGYRNIATKSIVAECRLELIDRLS